MQFEDFDKKIIEAADNHHPAYDEQAWAKMEKLLNKHMPVKKDRRRGIVFFLLFLGLLTGGATLYYFNGRGHAQPVVSGTEANRQPVTAANGNNTITTGKQSGTAGTRNQDESENPSADHNNVPATNNVISETNNTISSADHPVPAKTAGTAKVNTNLLKETYSHALQDAFNANLKKSRKTDAGIQKTSGSILTGITTADPEGRHTKKSTRDLLPGKDQPDQGQIISKLQTKNNEELHQQTTSVEKPVNAAVDNKDPEMNSPVQTARPNTGSTVARKESSMRVNPEVATAVAAISAKSKGRSGKSAFFIALSGGPDVSVVGVSNTGRVKMVGGGGLGYTIKGKFTLRTGFYTARKVYTASPDQYHPPSSFWSYYPNLQKVDADCRVYEIPLLFTYNFAKKGNSNWFTGIGISSYLMKRETYNYFYKTMAGVNTSRKYTLQDQNHHYFSVLTLSAGYQRSLGKNLFISAEPYLKIPLSGIGYGKINLNSAGMLFTAGWVPFHPKKATSKTH